ncbi:MAG TPA: preprotein translocase subunit SecG [Myxococcota bacterium]|nr:preprotein translocase subunit SecG [Myxococcota bacterium]
MTLFVTMIYFVVCLLLIVLVLMQHGKGADIGVSLGGGASNTVFGARGAGSFLTRVTTGSAILFMILAFGLARCATEVEAGSDLLSAPAAPAAEKKAETPAAPPAEESKPAEPGTPPSGFEAVEPPKPAEPAPAPAK